MTLQASLTLPKRSASRSSPNFVAMIFCSFNIVTLLQSIEFIGSVRLSLVYFRLCVVEASNFATPAASADHSGGVAAVSRDLWCATYSCRVTDKRDAGRT